MTAVRQLMHIPRMTETTSQTLSEVEIGVRFVSNTTHAHLELIETVK